MACKSVAHLLIALLAAAAAVEEAACFANGTCPSVEADNAALLQGKHLQSVRRQSHALAPMATCEPAENVKCPGSSSMCIGDQCCPRVPASGDLTFPCPSASRAFDRCESPTKVADCLPKVCCQATNAKCLACSAGMTEEAYCQQNPTTPGCPPRACCRAMNAKCLACSAGMTEEAYCQQNPTVPGCYARLLQSNSSTGLRKGRCQYGAHVPCPGSGNMCAGDQCCPRTAASGEKTFPCPSAAPTFADCESNVKLEDCLEPQACCQAMNAKCLACSAGMTEETYCQQNPTTPGCPPRACCQAMNAKCLACSAGMTEEAYCQQNPTVPGCYAGLLQSNSSKGLRDGGCQHGAHVPCPGSGNMCAGDQCCPRTAASGEKTFPCPSAAPTFADCESNVKLEDCLEPQACCQAMNAKCLACSAGMTEEAYCQQNPTTPGCPPRACCQAMNAKCLACSAGMTEEAYCQQNPTTPGCPPRACCAAMTAQCLACSAGMTEEAYCQQNPTVPGCPPRACCAAMTAECLACSAGITEEVYCQQNPTVPGCPPQACCAAMTAECLACSAGMSEEEYCQQNPTTVGCPEPYQPETCSEGQSVPCPGSGNMCMGDQCCPGTEMSGGETFPCPSASEDFKGCAANTKLADCVAA